MKKPRDHSDEMASERIEKLTQTNKRRVPQMEKMQDRIRKTGIRVIGDAPWGTHLCQFYKTNEDLIEILVPYFKAGLENNEFCMWVTAEPLKAQEATTALRKAVRHLDDYAKKDQIEILDSGQWYTKSGKFDSDAVLKGWVRKENQALEKGFDGLRLSGNTFWLEKADWRDFAEYEGQVNKVIGGRRMMALCSYCLDKCSAPEIIDVVQNHQFALVRRAGEWEIIESSERRLAEETLKAERDLTETALNTQTDTFFVFEPVTGKAVRWNKAFNRISGYSDEEIRSMKAPDSYYNEEDLKKAAAAVQKTLKEEIATVELSLITKDGRSILTEYTGSAIIDNEANAKYIIAIGRDITKRKKMERVLEESEQRYRTLFENTGTATLIIEPDMTISLVNMEFEKLSGYSREEVEGKRKWTDLAPIDGLERLTKYHQIRRNDPNAAPRNYEVRFTDKLGNVKDVFVTVALIPGTEKSVASVLDISEYKRIEKSLREAHGELEQRVEESSTRLSEMVDMLRDAEVRYRTVADFTHDWEYWETPDNRLRYVSPSCESITGFAPQDFVSNPGLVEDLIIDEDKHIWRKHREEPLRHGHKGLQFRIRRRDGEVRWIEHVCRPVTEAEGNFLGFRASNRDVTERKRAEERVREKTLELQAANENLKRLLEHLEEVREEERTGIARELHDELGQVLTALRMDASWIEKKIEEDQTSVRDKTKEMIRLIDSTIRTVQRISSDLRPGILDDLGLAAAIEWQGQEFERRYGIKCRVSCHGCEAVAERYSTALFRIVQEALTNVARHANATEVTVHLEADQSGLSLEVSDNGKGITQKRINDKNSFGLNSMRQRVGLLKGSFSITGAKGKGTTLKVTLPPET